MLCTYRSLAWNDFPRLGHPGTCHADLYVKLSLSPWDFAQVHPCPSISQGAPKGRGWASSLHPQALIYGQTHSGSSVTIYRTDGGMGERRDEGQVEGRGTGAPDC